MPSYSKLLDDTMLHTAARGHGRVEPADATGGFHAPVPEPVTDPEMIGSVDTIRKNPIWQFKWDPGTPARFEKLTLKTRGMGMAYKMAASVAELVKFEDVVLERTNGERVVLPLGTPYMVEASWLRTGKIPESSSGLWHLEARTDTSVMVAFAYQWVCGALLPIPKDEIEALGESFMPDRTPELFQGIAGDDAEALVCIGPVRYLVVVELVTCKEHNDFVPGGLIGMARFHPHLMLISNEDLQSYECTLELRRHRKAMSHGDPEMGTEHKALVVSDTNTPNVPLPFAPKTRPIPYTDIIFDYYETDPAIAFAVRDPATPYDDPDPEFPDYPGDHPAQKPGEITLADRRFSSSRWISKAVRRTSLKPIEPGPSFVPIVKFPRQGQFDNIHFAPRMQTSFDVDGKTVTEDEIAMLFVCLHDCVHTHVRWGGFSGYDSEKMILGWGDNGLPFQEPGVPAVPPNQTVFVRFPTPHSMRYRALGELVPAGKWQVVYHHGSAYAIDLWPEHTMLVHVMRETIYQYATEFDEWYDDEMGHTWPAFYWRLRWGGKRSKPKVQRLSFDLERCMR